ncbi:WAP four-disulfide core domain protein 5, partial [Sciurus carolinensis]|nr:WAP four-disulfide core domain protein 5 [Sciurus carolinensis]
KWGGCPPDDEPCLLSVPDQCMNDRQCPSSLKCCYRACFRQCVPRVSVKLGSCPQDRLRCLSPTKHVCSQDSDCSGKKRCCRSACGRDCRDPARGTAPGDLGQGPPSASPSSDASLQFSKFNRSPPQKPGPLWPEPEVDGAGGPCWYGGGTGEPPFSS